MDKNHEQTFHQGVTDDKEAHKKTFQIIIMPLRERKVKAQQNSTKHRIE